jgi:hypothetical protein
VTDRDDPGPEHDAHLRAALRHAPDAALAPSAALDDAILQRARSATAEAPGNVSPQGASSRHDAEASQGPFSPPEAAPSRGAFAPQQPPRNDRPAAPARPTATTGRGIAGWWSWLARPSVATGFAGVMVATLVGVMWWGRPLDEAMPRRYETPAPAAPGAADRTAAAERHGDEARTAGRSNSTTNGVTAPEASKSDKAEPVSPPRPDSGPPDAPRRDKADPATKRSAPTPMAQTAPPPLAKRQAEPSAFPTPEASGGLRKIEPRAGESNRPQAETDATRARLADTARDSAASRGPENAAPGVSTEARSMPRFEAKTPEANAPAPASPPAPAQADRRPGSREAPPAAAPDDSTIAQKLRAPPERLALQQRPQVAAAQPPAVASAPREAPERAIAGAIDDRKTDSSEVPRRSGSSHGTGRAEAPSRSPLAPLRTALVTEAGRWAWSGDGGRVQRVTPELLAWLARLDVAIAAQPVDSRSAASAPDPEADAVPSTAPSGPVRAVVLLREGRRHTELRLGDALEVTPIDPPGPRWRVALTPETAAALRESLP